jgi:hypothetical protein
MTSLSELSGLSAQLNKESEHVNASIGRFNDALTSMNLGVQTWLPEYLWKGEYFTPPMPPTPLIPTTCADMLHEQESKAETDLRRSSKAVQLGFAKVEDRFQLAVRTVTVEEFVDRAGQSDERIVNPGDPQPLTKASRNLRIDALELLPRLTESIAARVKSLLKNIEAGKALNPEISSERTYVVRVLPDERYEIVYKGGHQRSAGRLRDLRMFLEQSAIVGDQETLDRVEKELSEKGESEVTTVWGKTFTGSPRFM